MKSTSGNTSKHYCSNGWHLLFLWQVKKSQELPIDVVICHLREYQFVTPCDLKLELQNEKREKEGIAWEKNLLL